MKLEGTLQTFTLRELIDMVIYSSVTGVLNLYDAGEIGHIYFRDGHIYHVELYSLRGIDALAALLELPPAAKFAFVSDTIVDEESIWGDPEFHLQSAERTAVRWRHVRPLVRSLTLVPRLLLAHEVAMNRAGPSYQPLLAVVDGRLSLHQIAARLSWAELDTAEAAARLRKDGVLELAEADDPGDSPSSSDEPLRRSDGSLFDRLRARVGRAAPQESNAARPTEAPARGGNEELILQILRSS